MSQTATEPNLELQTIRSSHSQEDSRSELENNTAEIEYSSLPPTDHSRQAYLVLLGCTLIQAPIWGKYFHLKPVYSIYLYLSRLFPLLRSLPRILRQLPEFAPQKRLQRLRSYHRYHPERSHVSHDAYYLHLTQPLPANPSLHRPCRPRNHDIQSRAIKFCNEGLATHPLARHHVRHRKRTVVLTHDAVSRRMVRVPQRHGIRRDVGREIRRRSRLPVHHVESPR